MPFGSVASQNRTSEADGRSSGRPNIERFVFPGETSSLSDANYDAALGALDWIERLLSRRTGALAEDPGFSLHLPAGNWDPAARQGFERDLAVTNPFTSFELVRSRNRDVIRQLRLYSQAFTGFQLATLERADRRPWIRRPLPANLDELIALLAHLPDPNVDKWARLVVALPPELCVSPPWKFGEMGWLSGDCIVNYDTWCYLHRLALLYESGVLGWLAKISRVRRPRIVEIGGGYGALAFALTRLLPDVDYTIVDIPESLAFSSIYLPLTMPSHRVELVDQPGVIDTRAQMRLCPNFWLSELFDAMQGVDLVVNVLSLNEMAQPQVEFYAAEVSRAIGKAGLFFEQNVETDRFGMKVPISSIFAAHFANRMSCPSTLVGAEMHPTRAQIWSNAAAPPAGG